MLLKVVAVCFVLACAVSGLKPNHEPTIVVRTLIPPPEDCSVQAQKGDSVWIEHKGLYEGKLVDANPEGEPLKVPLGKNRILKGMEEAIFGMCAGEQREVDIPPHLGYEEKGKNFKNAPVPKGATVTYQITVVEIDRPGSLKNRLASFVSFLKVVLPVGVFLALVVVYLKYFYKPADKSKKSKGKGK